MSRTRKREAERRGRRAESLSAWWLRFHGWRILARRSRPAEAAAAVSPRAQARIARAAEAYLAANPALQGLVLRFDVMLVTPRRAPVHIPNAWHILR